jgi:hypothetical protein
VSAAEDRPDLSVVVALISGAKGDVARCLDALHRQNTAIDMEILVPYDQPASNVTELAARFPGVKFIPAEESRSLALRGGFVREHHDTLRTVGIINARGRIIALTEDHAHASDDWCAAMIDAIDRFP